MRVVVTLAAIVAAALGGAVAGAIATAPPDRPDPALTACRGAYLDAGRALDAYRAYLGELRRHLDGHGDVDRARALVRTIETHDGVYRDARDQCLGAASTAAIQQER